MTIVGRCLVFFLRDKANFWPQIRFRGLGGRGFVWYIRVQRSWLDESIVLEIALCLQDYWVPAVVDNTVNGDLWVLVVDLCLFLFVVRDLLRKLLLQLLSLL